MTVQIDIDEKIWAEAQRLASELNIDYKELFARTFRKSLYSMKRDRDRALSTAEKEKRHLESYEKFPVGDDEFFIEDEQLEEVWKDL